MTTTHEAYSSTVTSRSHLIVGLVTTVIWVGIVLALSGYWGVAVAGAILLVGASVFVSTVRVVIGNGRVVLGQGPLAWPSRTIPIGDIADAKVEDLSRSEEFGAGLGWRGRVTRLTVRPGPTLALILTSGERVRVSTARPDQAVALISTARRDLSPDPSDATMTEPLQDHRPWFGPKRFGYGISPKTWQGWVIVLGGAALFALVLTLLTR
jgi:hypothetical protein